MTDTFWTYTILESFCGYRWMTKKEYELYKIDTTTSKTKIKTKKTSKKIYNSRYTPPSKRPAWCRKHNKGRTPQFRCLSDDKTEKKCPFYTFTEADKPDYKVLEEGMNKYYKKLEDKIDDSRNRPGTKRRNSSNRRKD